MELIPPVIVSGLYIGSVGLLPGESRGSAIAKKSVDGPVVISHEGLAGDEQADTVAHGGAHQAVHLFPVEHYSALAQAFPAARHLAPGGLGENLSTHGLTEETVCLGDIFQFGSARLQVSRPRTPCWKIDARCGVDGVAAHIAHHGTAGWYFRVLTPGSGAAGDALIHLERPAGAVTLARFQRTLAEHRPALATLEHMATAPGLAPALVHRIRQRMAWLINNERT